MNTSQNGMFASTMSPGASFCRFKINLQQNNSEGIPNRAANSTLANKANTKLLPIVNPGSPNSKRQTNQKGRGLQSYD